MDKTLAVITSQMHSVDLKLLMCNVIVLLTEQQIVNKVAYSRHCTLIGNNEFLTLITFLCSVGVTHGCIENENNTFEGQTCAYILPQRENIL